MLNYLVEKELNFSVVRMHRRNFIKTNQSKSIELFHIGPNVMFFFVWSGLFYCFGTIIYVICTDDFKVA